MQKVKHLYLNFSTYDLYKVCPAKVKYQVIDSLQPEIDPIAPRKLEATTKGTIIHKVLDAASQRLDWEDVFNAEIAKHPVFETLKASQSGSKEHLHMIIEKYFSRYGLIETQWQTLQSEIKLEMPINSWLTAVGTLDKIVLRDGEKFLIDHKTSSGLQKYLEPKVRMSDQFTLYQLLCQANGYDVKGIIIDGICTDRTVLDKDKELFIRYETTRSADQCADFLERFERVGVKLKDSLEKDLFDPVRNEACSAFNSRCPFYDACVAPVKQITKNILTNNFIKGEPNASCRVIWDTLA